MLALLATAFALVLGYVYLCLSLTGPDKRTTEPTIDGPR